MDTNSSFSYTVLNNNSFNRLNTSSNVTIIPGYTPITLYIAYVVAIMIVLSNLPVVISSGLILKKGQKPKSTYILLGNVSLADTILGAFIIYGITQDVKTDSAFCVPLMGFLVCPAMVSIFSVGFIAVDRYIYIVHGLHYKMWINTRRVRIGIVLIWLMGITLSFMPITGWTNKDIIIIEYTLNCNYINVFPGELILINSFISIIPIIVVVVLYSIILVKALKTVKMITGTNKVNNIEEAVKDKPKLRMNRGTVNKVISNNKIVRSASLDFGKHVQLKTKHKSRSIEDLTINNSKSKSTERCIYICRFKRASNYSVNTVESNISLNMTNNINFCDRFSKSVKAKTTRQKEPNKWRAITVVMLTSASFMVTWMPFFIVVVFYVLCEGKKTNERCLHYRYLASSPLCILGFLNSLLNPLIYAWWHKGFKRSVKNYCKRLFSRCFKER